MPAAPSTIYGGTILTTPAALPAGTYALTLSPAGVMGTVDLDGLYQPLDADLTALAALSGTNTIYYRSAPDTWSAVVVGTGLDFSGGTLSCTVTPSSGANPTALVGLSAVNGSAGTFLRSDAAPALDQSIEPTWTGSHTYTKNGAASTPTMALTGTAFTGGTTTTTKPLVLIEPTGIGSTNWSTAGTYLGVNAPTDFTGRVADFKVGTSRVTVLSEGGNARLECTTYIISPQGIRNDNSGTVWIIGSTGVCTLRQLTVIQGATGTTASIVRGIASRTAPLLQLQTSASAPIGNVGGTIAANYADASSTSTDGTHDDLYSFTTVANTLANNGDSIRGRIGVQLIGHATATRQLRLVFAGTTIFDTTALTCASNTNAVIHYTLIRASSTVVRYMVTIDAPGLSSVVPPAIGEVTGLTLTATNILKLTGSAAGAGAASADIVAALQWIDRGEQP